eukprot:3419591-Rhodomonas_salina.1
MSVCSCRCMSLKYSAWPQACRAWVTFMESVSTVTWWSGGVPWRVRNITSASAWKEDEGLLTWALDTSSPGGSACGSHVWQHTVTNKVDKARTC